MKKSAIKLFASLLAVAMLITMTAPIALASNAEEITNVGRFYADKTDVDSLTEKKSVTFMYDAKTQKKLVGGVTVTDSKGNATVRLFDNGKDGDKKANDGIYSGTVSVEANQKSTKTYSACISGKAVAEWNIYFYNRVSDTDVINNDAVFVKLDRIEKMQLDKGQSYEATFNAVYNAAKNDSRVKTITSEGDYSFSFTMKSGIGSSYTLWEAKNALSPSYSEEQALVDAEVKASSDYVSYQNPNAMTFRPYRNSPAMGDFSNEVYTSYAQKFCNITGGRVTDYIESSAYPGNLINIADNGLFIVDSHGVTASGRSYMLMRRGNTSAYDFNADLSAGHIITSDSDIAVTGSFFTKYLTAAGKTIPGTLVYLATCYGLSNSGISSPLLNLGAVTCVGYDASVSFTYDFRMSAVVFDCLTSVYPGDAPRTYTISEAVAKAKSQCGSYDSYADDRAHMIIRGAENYLLIDSDVYVEGVNVTPEYAELYTNNTVKLEATVYPEAPTSFTLEYESSDTSVALVDQNGLVTAKEAGEAVITCKVTDTLNDINNVFTKEVVINCKGHLAVDSIVFPDSFTLYTGMEPQPLNCYVLPANATNPLLLYSSSDESIVKVDENGYASALADGKANITVTSADSGQSVIIEVFCTFVNYEMAVNAPGGTLNIQNDEQYPWQLDVEGDRVSVKSGNTGVNGSKSTLTLVFENTAPGATLSFDWKISSEERWDYMSFRVNSAAVPSIPNISGVMDFEKKLYTMLEAKTYTFTWSYTKDVGIPMELDTAWLDNVDVTYEGLTHRVTFFDMDTTTVLSNQMVEHGESAIAPEPPIHEGYEFVGWSEDFSVVRADLFVYALYSEKQDVVLYTVTFIDGFDGKVISSVQVEEGKAAELPETPSHVGQAFLGWEGEYSCILADTTITARYKALGDANSDGEINTGDVVVMLKFVVGAMELDSALLPEVDMNHDGRLTTGDASALLIALIAIT